MCFVVGLAGQLESTVALDHLFDLLEVRERERRAHADDSKCQCDDRLHSTMKTSHDSPSFPGPWSFAVSELDPLRVHPQSPCKRAALRRETYCPSTSSPEDR